VVTLFGWFYTGYKHKSCGGKVYEKDGDGNKKILLCKDCNQYVRNSKDMEFDYNGKRPLVLMENNNEQIR